MIKGYVGALLEVLLFGVVTYSTSSWFAMPALQYYWYCFTVLTAFWEFIYVTEYGAIVNYAKGLLQRHEHVWTMTFPLAMVLPQNMARLFYAEYGAYADREYMTKVEYRHLDYWSRLVESSHALLCGWFAGVALLLSYLGYYDHSTQVAMFGMGCQLMNSILYMGQYFLQCNIPGGVNNNTVEFPLGRWMSKRPFMWVNIFWSLMPVMCLSQSLYMLG